MDGIIEVAMLAILIYRPSIWLAIWFGVLVAFRRVPWFANEIARMLDLDEQVGMTAWAGRVLLPAWDGAVVMLNDEDDEPRIIAQPVVHVPVPRTDTNAVEPPDRDITRDAWLKAMALARDEKGKYIFSSNDIHDACHGHRATVLARVKELRAGDPPPQFRAEDGATTPATYPVSKSQEDSWNRTNH